MATPRSGEERGDNVGQNTKPRKSYNSPQTERATRRTEIRNQRAILRTVSGETGESFPRLKLKNHSSCGDARTAEKANEINP